MGNITFCGQHETGIDAEIELMFPGTVKEIRLSRTLMTALDEMSHAGLSADVCKAFIDLYNHYQWQMEQGYP